ncbi:Endogenous retrovirus group FC1 Env polyprotein [Plecturocebus cupreus]
MAGLFWSPIISRYNHLPPGLLPSLSLLRHLLREHADSALPVVLGPRDSCPAATLQPGDSVLLRELQPGSLQPRSSKPHIVILTTPTAAKLLGHTPWYHVSRLKVAPQNDQWKSESLGSTCLRLTRSPCLPIPDPSNSPPNNPSNESWGEGPTTKTQYIAQVDCRPTDCKSIKFEFPKSIANTLKCSQNNFGLCFLHNQTKIVCHKWSGIFGGCPYASCVMHKAPKSEMLVINNQGKVSLTIRDPWHARWEKGTAGKIYTKYTNSHPSGTWLIYKSYTCTVPREIDQLTLLGNTILQNEATLTNQLKPPSSNSQPFSWLALVQQGVNMLSLTEAINFTNCFLCASLNEPPLAAVPLRTGFNLSQSPMGPDITLTGIPLFKAHSPNLSLCYGTTNNSSCNTNVRVKSTHYAPPEGYFWCNGSLTKVINASLPFPCVPVTLVPQLKVYGRAEFQSLLTPPPPRPPKQTSYLPPRTSSLVAAGIGSRAMGYSVTSPAQLEDKLRVAIKASAASLASLQQQITSLAQRRISTLSTISRKTSAKAKYRSFVSKLVASHAYLANPYHPACHCNLFTITNGPFSSQVPTNLYVRNWTSARQPNAASSLHPVLSQGTSQLTFPPYFALIQQEVVRKSGALYHQKVKM